MSGMSWVMKRSLQIIVSFPGLFRGDVQMTLCQISHSFLTGRRLMPGGRQGVLELVNGAAMESAWD